MNNDPPQNPQDQVVDELQERFNEKRLRRAAKGNPQPVQLQEKVYNLKESVLHIIFLRDYTIEEVRKAAQEVFKNNAALSGKVLVDESVDYTVGPLEEADFRTQVIRALGVKEEISTKIKHQLNSFISKTKDPSNSQNYEYIDIPDRVRYNITDELTCL
jgi:hypothetical protein